MNHNLTLIPAALLLAAFASHPAFAQVPGPSLPIIGSPTAIAIGGYLPSGDASRRGGSVQITGEFRYTLFVPNPLNAPARTVAALGVEYGSKSGNHSLVVPLTVGEIVGFNGSPTAGGVGFGGGGVGAFYESQSGVSSQIRLGGYVELGYNVTSMVFVDAKYQMASHANGATVMAGLRF